jgi:CPA2 family monovalent cation:H+ antiporter-2
MLRAPETLWSECCGIRWGEIVGADALHSPAGHVAVGWLLVEDVLTVIVLVMIPVLGHREAEAEAATGMAAATAIGIALLKLVALVAVVVVAGQRFVPWALTQVARLRSRELFTLTVMVSSIAVAAGAYALFGASMALGAFLAGMVVAQSPVSHQAAADALPLRDAFAVLFFVAVGMLFDPLVLLAQPLMILAALGVILLVKPLVALLIVLVLGHSVRTALTVALGLAQIGEFSFILSDLARKHGVMPEAGHSVLVAGAILSITLNPLLFRSLPRIEAWLRRRPRIWSLLNARAEQRVSRQNESVAQELMQAPQRETPGLAVVVGYGPVGQTVDRLLLDAGLKTVIIDMNMDTVADLRNQGRTAIFGDASREAILESAGIEGASHLVLTLPQSSERVPIVALARNLNPRLKIFVRARYLRERDDLEQVGATAAIFEEAEAAVALARLVLADRGAGRERIERAVRDVRLRLILDNVSTLGTQRVRNIMVPWTRVRRLSTSATLEDVRSQVSEKHFSRWPVVDGQTGLPTGYLLVKDLIGLHSQEGQWTSLVRPLGLVAPEEDIEATLRRFQEEGTTICIVSDRGSPVGIVTIEDILEQVIGRIEDEYPHEPRLSLGELIYTDHTLLALVARTSEQAIAEMAERIPEEWLPVGAEVAARAIEREREIPTDLGVGIAIPHARCPDLVRPLVLFGRSEQGVVFDRQTGEPVFLIFLLVTPAEQPNLQVMLLSDVARLAGDALKRSRLKAATSVEEVCEILKGIGSKE